MINTMENTSMNNYKYGTAEYGEELQTIANEYNISPILDMWGWSKQYYDEHVNTWPATIMHFICMIIDEESSDDAILAGWILSLNSILTSKENLEQHGMPRDAQLQIIRELYNKIIRKSKFIYYHVENYFHTHPAFARNFHEIP